jgi:hypothetical protein
LEVQGEVESVHDIKGVGSLFLLNRPSGMPLIGEPLNFQRYILTPK